MSTHRIECVPVKLEPHAGADALSVVRVFGGYTVCVRTQDWQGRDRGIYIEPDYVVPLDRPEFAFLQKPGETKQSSRIKVKKLRGVISHGLLIPAPDGARIGDDFMDQYGIKRYEPPAPFSTGGEVGPGPSLTAPKYDVEPWRKYSSLFNDGEMVYITEKLHGASARYCFSGGTFFVGSRTEWKRESSTNLWWQAARQQPWIEAWCRANPDWILYGEVFGRVQDLNYDAPPGKYFFRAFDILTPMGWMSADGFSGALDSDKRVPALYSGPYSAAIVEATAKGNSTLAGHMREGCVIKPAVERFSEKVGRVVLKCINDTYLEK